MKIPAAVALIGIAMVSGSYAGAQRGGHGGGLSGHAGGSFRGGFSASRGSFSASAAPRYVSAFRPVATAGTRYRRPYRYRYTGPAIYGVGGWVNPGYLAYDTGYDSGYNDDPGYAAPPYPDPGQAGPIGPPDPSMMPQPQAPVAYASAPAAEPASEDAVTLVFKDGRPNQQVHNYALTRSTLYVLDQHRREIAVGDLDLAATVKLNQESGVDFHPPAAR